jgi:hypothetical protein
VQGRRIEVFKVLLDHIHGRAAEKKKKVPRDVRSSGHDSGPRTHRSVKPYKSRIDKTKLQGLSPRANYTDRATAAYRRSDCQFVRIEGATWSA